MLFDGTIVGLVIVSSSSNRMKFGIAVGTGNGVLLISYGAVSFWLMEVGRSSGEQNKS